MVSGFTLEEAKEIALVIGRYKGVRVVELVELNPAIEYYITCSTVVKLFYLMLISQSS